MLGLVDDEAKNPLVLNVWSVETPRYPIWMQGVWQSHSRHADQRKVSKHKHPSTRKYLAGTLGAHPTRRPSFPRKILGVQSRLAGLHEHTDLRRSHVWGAQLGWQGRRHTKILQDLGIMARRPRGGHFCVQTTNIAAGHLAEP
jgi:hypothetical protein